MSEHKWALWAEGWFVLLLPLMGAHVMGGDEGISKEKNCIWVDSDPWEGTVSPFIGETGGSRSKRGSRVPGDSFSEDSEGKQSGKEAVLQTRKEREQKEVECKKTAGERQKHPKAMERYLTRRP